MSIWAMVPKAMKFKTQSIIVLCRHIMTMFTSSVKTAALSCITATENGAT